jgi:hypothetical protein
MNNQLLNEKLNHLRRVETNENGLYRISKCHVLDVPPQAKYASFPFHDYTPYCQPLTPQELLKEI